MKFAALTTAAMSFAGLAAAEPQAAMLRTGSAVTPVLTEHSSGLRCLGGLIEQSPMQAVAVLIHEIEDTTIPRFNEERRLSKGGAFVLQTAVSRLETDKAHGVIDEDRAGPRRLTLSGAWTQDDHFVTQGGAGVRARVGNYGARVGGRNAYDFVAGDFASSVNGRVILSTAVGVALSRKGREALLIVDDGRNGAEIGLDKRTVQGPQMAQRRILEAVALVHMAHYFKIDYRPCLEATHAQPAAFTAALDRYERYDAGARHRAMQIELVRLGHFAGEPSTRWDAASRVALAAFQSARRLPPTGQPSAVLYALLATSASPPKP
jgi:hypothetical protein